MTSQFGHDQHELELDWNTDAIVERRNTFYAASQRAFVPYQKPLIFKRGQDNYLWEALGFCLFALQALLRFRKVTPR